MPFAAAASDRPRPHTAPRVVARVIPLHSLERRAREDRDEVQCCARCYGRWLRTRLMEHWRGERYWAELDRGDFGLLSTARHPRGTLFADIVALIATGSENLTVITWALETGRPVEEVVDILTLLDVNARRVPVFTSPMPALRCSRFA
jgi:hypothetical protein